MSDEDSVAIVISEGSYDKAMAGLFMATTAAGMGMQAHVFFTFFGLNLLKKGADPKLSGMYRLFTGMFKKKMKNVGIGSYQETLETAKDLGVKLYACNTTLNALGMKKEELIDGVDILGAAAFLDIASNAKVDLFLG
jgi:peroxiredoxin family protein